MGLDMYLYRTLKGNVKDFKIQNSDFIIEFAYWRKHYELDRWMQCLYKQKGGKELFNCQALPLDLDDLAKLEKDIKNKEFNSEYYDSWYHQEGKDMETIKKARECIKNDEEVFYFNWW